MRRRGAVIMIDPKGDRSLWARAAAEAQRHQKPFGMFLTAFPEHSATFNPLASAQTPLEIAARIEALTPDTKEPYFTGFSLAYLTKIAAAQQQLGIPWRLTTLYEASVLRQQFEMLVHDYLALLGCYQPPRKGESPLTMRMRAYEAQGLHDPTADALINYVRWPGEHRQKVTSTLLPTFHGVVDDIFAPLLSPQDPDLTWARIIREGMVVYFGLSSMLFPSTANRVARTIVQDLLGYLGRRYAYEEPATMSPITVLIDEFGGVAYEGAVDALAQVRGANVRFILAMQSRADVEAKLGSQEGRRLFENMNKLWFRLADVETAETVLRGQTCRIPLPSPPAVGIRYGDTGGLSGGTQIQARLYEVPAVRPSFLTTLTKGEAFALKEGILYKLRVPLLTPVSSRTLDGLGLTAMWKRMDPTTQLPKEASWTPLSRPAAPFSVPPDHWLPSPSSRALPAGAVMPTDRKPINIRSKTSMRIAQRITRWWRDWGRRKAK